MHANRQVRQSSQVQPELPLALSQHCVPIRSHSIRIAGGSASGAAFFATLAISLFFVPDYVLAATVFTLIDLTETSEKQRNDHDETLRFAEALHEPKAETHLTSPQVPLEETADTRMPIGVEIGPQHQLRHFRLDKKFVLGNKDASGVAFISDDVVLITYQNILEFRDLDGTVLSSIDGVEGDVEGLEYNGERLIAVAEQGSTHIELALHGMEIEQLGNHQLGGRGIECIAYDPDTDVVYYGQESSGKLINDRNEIVHSFTRDLSACTVHAGEMMAITSHPWRQSVWYRIDMQTWNVLESKLLPDGDWEGVTCRGNTCVLVRESSEKSTAAMHVYINSEGYN